MGAYGPLFGMLAKQPKLQTPGLNSQQGSMNQYPSYVNQGMQQQQSKGLFGKVGEFFSGKPDYVQNLPLHSPQVMNIQNQLAGLGYQGAQDVYGRMMQDPNQAFNPIEELARKNYMERTLPGIKEQFVQGGGQRGSAFARVLGSSGSDLDAQLAALRSQFGENRLGMQANYTNQLLNQGMQRQFEPNVRTNQGGAGGDMLATLMKLAPYIAML